MNKATSSWEAVEKEIAYFERQCELFTASLSSFISAKTTLTVLSASTSSKVVPFEVEVEFFSRSSSSEGILLQMERTVSGIKKKLESFTTTVDALFKDRIQEFCAEIQGKCGDQLAVCRKAFHVSVNESILSEEKSKSLLSLVIHRPFIWDLKHRVYPDVKSLIQNKAV